MKKLLFVALVVGLLSSFAMPVLAAAPTRSDGTVDMTVVLGDCGDFQIIDHAVWDYTVTFYSSGQGVPTRAAEKGRGTDYIYSSIRPDRIVTGSILYNAQVDLTTGGFSSSGRFWHVVVRGEGNLYFQIGRQTFVNDELVFDAGPRSDIEALCNYLRE